MSLPEVFCVFVGGENVVPEDRDALITALKLAGYSEGGAWDFGGGRADSVLVYRGRKTFQDRGNWCKPASNSIPELPLATVIAELSPKKATFVVRDISLGGKWNQLQSALLLAGYTNVDAMPWFLGTSWIAIVNSATKRFAMGPEEHLEWHKQRPSVLPVKTFEEAIDLIIGPKDVVGHAMLLESGAIVDQHADGKFTVPEPWLSIINERDKELAQLRSANEALAHKLDEIDDRNLSLLAKLSAKKSIDFHPEPSPYIRQLAAAELRRGICQAIWAAMAELRAIVISPLENDLLDSPKKILGVPVEVEAHTAGVSGWHLVHKVVEPEKPFFEKVDITAFDETVLLNAIAEDVGMWHFGERRVLQINQGCQSEEVISRLKSDLESIKRRLPQHMRERLDLLADSLEKLRDGYKAQPPQPEPEYREPTKWDHRQGINAECTYGTDSWLPCAILSVRDLAILICRPDDTTRPIWMPPDSVRILVDDADREWQLKCKMFDAINSAEHLALEEEPGWRWSTYPLAGFELAISSTSGRSATRTLIKRPFRWCKAKVRNLSIQKQSEEEDFVMVTDAWHTSASIPLEGTLFVNSRGLWYVEGELTDIRFIDGETL